MCGADFGTDGVVSWSKAQFVGEHTKGPGYFRAPFHPNKIALRFCLASPCSRREAEEEAPENCARGQSILFVLKVSGNFKKELLLNGLEQRSG